MQVGHSNSSVPKNRSNRKRGFASLRGWSRKVQLPYFSKRTHHPQIVSSVSEPVLVGLFYFYFYLRWGSGTETRFLSHTLISLFFAPSLVSLLLPTDERRMNSVYSTISTIPFLSFLSVSPSESPDDHDHDQDPPTGQFFFFSFLPRPLLPSHLEEDKNKKTSPSKKNHRQNHRRATQ